MKKKGNKNKKKKIIETKDVKGGKGCGGLQGRRLMEQKKKRTFPEEGERK